jgi:hypothetical protein
VINEDFLVKSSDFAMKTIPTYHPDHEKCNKFNDSLARSAYHNRLRGSSGSKNNGPGIGSGPVASNQYLLDNRSTKIKTGGVNINAP